MSNVLAIGGAGGGGSSSSSQTARTPVTSPDSLQSKAMISVIDVISEGEIGGLVNGGESVFFNDTPLQNPDGSYNFNGATWEARNGTQTQSPMSGFSDIATPRVIGVQVKKSAPYVFSVTNPNADSVNVIVSFPSLYKQNATTGDISGTTVKYKFAVKQDDGEFTDADAGRAWSGDNVAGTSSNYNVAEKAYVASAESVAGAVGVGCTVKLTHTLSQGSSATLQPQHYLNGVWVDCGQSFQLSADWSADPDTGVENVPQTLRTTEEVSTSLATKMRLVVRSYIVGGVDKTSTIDPSAISITAVRGLMTTATITVTGKTSGKYQRQHMIKLPRIAGRNPIWQIKMTRVTDDRGSNMNLSNDTYLDTAVEIVDSRLSYPNTALFGVKIDSSQFNQIPTRSYLIDGIKIKVPNNYDPKTRTYSGIWDGGFKNAVSDNPAWILYDIVTTRRYGLGRYIQPELVNKGTLYMLGQYCDEMVPTTNGGLEPRFTINTQIQGQTEAFKLLCDISSAFRGMIYWDGSVNLFYDHPKDPVVVYGRANVIDGMFNYAGAARKDRHSVVLVTWNNPDNGYKQEVEYIENTDLIAKFGVRQIETVAFGCTSRTQARRAGLWILYTEQYESEILSFKVGQDSALVRPGDIALINDPTRAGKRMAGRLMACTPTSATLDSTITLDTYNATLSLRMPSGEFKDVVVKELAGEHKVLTWDEPLTELPVANAIFIVIEQNLHPMRVRIVGISEGTGSERGIYTITALEYNPYKFDEIEREQQHTEYETSVSNSVPAKVTGLHAYDSIYKSGSSILSRISLSWDVDTTGTVNSWFVRVRAEEEGNWTNYNSVLTPSIDLENLNDGVTYICECYARNILGNLSATPATVVHTVVGKSRPPSSVTGFVSAIDGSRMTFKWDHVADVDLREYEVRTEDLWDAANADKIVYRGIANSFSVPSADPVASDTTLYVKAVDTSGNYSARAAMVNVVYVAPTSGVLTTNYEVGPLAASAIIDWPESTSDFPIRHYEITIRRPGKAAEVILQTARTYTLALDFVGDAEFVVVAVDDHGKRSEPMMDYIESIAPMAPETVEFKDGIEGAVTMQWGSGVATTLPIAGYEVRSADANWGDNTHAYRGVSASYKFGIVGVGLTKFYIRAFDTMGRYSSNTLVATYEYTGPKFEDGAAISVEFPTSSLSSSDLRISWPAATSPFGISGYKITLTKPGIGAPLEITSLNNEVTTFADWIGIASCKVTALDVAGNEGSITGDITCSVPNPIVGVQISIISSAKEKMSAKVSWDSEGLRTSLPIAGYEIRQTDTLWGTGSEVYRGDATQATLTNISTVQDRLYYIRPYDTAGHFSDTSYEISILKNVGPDSVTGIKAKPQGNFLLLDWKDATTSGGEVFYEVRETTAENPVKATDWGAVDPKPLYYGSPSKCLIQLESSGQHTFLFRVRDRFWHWSEDTQFVYDYQVPSVTNLKCTFSAAEAQFTLTWTAAKPAFGLSEYVISDGTTTWNRKATSITLPATGMVDASKTFSVTVKDANDVMSAPASVVATFARPSDIIIQPTIKQTSKDSDSKANLKIIWAPATKGSLAIAGYELRSTDSGWGDGEALYDGPGTRASVNGVPKDSITTWYLRAYDKARNYAANATVITHNGTTAPAILTGFASESRTDRKVRISWTPSSENDVVEYEVRTSDANWGLKKPAPVYRGAEAWCDITPPTAGATFYVIARDDYKKVSPVASYAYAYPTPAAPSAATYFYDKITGKIRLDFPDVIADFGVKYYEVSYTDGLGKAITLKCASSSTDIVVNWSGDKEFTIRTVDNYGVKSEPISIIPGLQKPSAISGVTTSVISFVKGNQIVRIDWPDATLGTFKVAGYEVRSTNANWGTTTPATGFIKQVTSSTIDIQNVSATSPTTLYIKPFDNRGIYSDAATTVVFDPSLPNDPSGVTVKLKKGVLNLTAAGVKPSDFSHYEFRVGKVVAGATAGDDVGATEGVVATSTEDIWGDPDAITVKTSTLTSNTATLAVSSFSKPRFSKSGVTYRVSCRMVDQMGNYSANSAKASIVVKSL